MENIKIKQSTTNRILIWVMVLITAGANEITTWNSTMVLAMLLTLFVFIARDEKIDNAFLYFTIAFVLVFSIHIFKFGYIDFREAREYIKIFYAYIFIKLVYKDFFKIYTDIIYKLAIISLPLYVLQLIDYQLMKSIIGIIENNISFLNYREGWYENLFIFTLNDQGMYRNSGFAWEPKGFGTFLTLAFFFQLILNKFRFFDKKTIVYLIAIATTLSTATYSIFLLGVLLFYIYNKPSATQIVSFVLVVPLIIIAFTQLDFMQEKIVHEYETKDKFAGYVTDTKFKGESRSLGRFGSFIVDYADIKKEPLFGYGLFSEERTRYSVMGVKLVRVNGFSDLMAKIGFFGMFLYIIFLFYSFKQIAKRYKFKGYFILPISIIITSFGSAILLKPLYLALFCYGMIKKETNDN